jgi:lipoyl(octanoyl) transferase
MNKHALENAPCPWPIDLEWRVSSHPVAYGEAVQAMEERVGGILRREVSEQVWLLEHPPTYTAGTSARQADLIEARFPVVQTGRGGQFTYHGPGQRVAYVMLDLNARKADIRGFVRDLEEWLIKTLAEFGVSGERRSGRVGIWVGTGNDEAKIAAIGIRVRRWVTFHGISLNVNPDLSHYSGIVPCGVSEHGVTSLAALGLSVSLGEVDDALKRMFGSVFKGNARASAFL